MEPMNLEWELEQAQRAVQKGERSRILFEILLSEIGCSFENSTEEIWNELTRIQDEYNEAIKILSTVIKERSKEAYIQQHTPKKESFYDDEHKGEAPKESVSVSNY